MIYSVIHFFVVMWIVLENINIIRGKLITVYRPLWHAREHTNILSRFHLPVKYFQISICQTQVCDTIPSCSLIVSKIQDEHMTQNGWADIGYNFLVDGLGHVYEGTGWYTRAVQSEKEFLSICLFGIGNYRNPQKGLLDGIEKILQFGKEIGYLSRVAKPLLNSKELTKNQTDEFRQKQLNWEKTILENANYLSSDESENADNLESKETIFGVDWSKVFPNQGNRTALNSVISHKQTVGQSNWKKVFSTPDEVTSVDWSSLLRHNSRNQDNWTGIFDNNNFDVSNLNSFLLSRQPRTNIRLGYNNDW